MSEGQVEHILEYKIRAIVKKNMNSTYVFLIKIEAVCLSRLLILLDNKIVCLLHTMKEILWKRKVCVPKTD